jgi:hypothetical protein
MNTFPPVINITETVFYSDTMFLTCVHWHVCGFPACCHRRGLLPTHDTKVCPDYTPTDRWKELYP